MAGLISDMVIDEAGELLMVVEWSSRRNAMSPVPPAMSSMVQGSLPEPGLMERTK